MSTFNSSIIILENILTFMKNTILTPYLKIIRLNADNRFKAEIHTLIISIIMQTNIITMILIGSHFSDFYCDYCLYSDY